LFVTADCILGDPITMLANDNEVLLETYKS